MTVSLIFGGLLAIGLFYRYRELFGEATVAAAGALIRSVAPNVWAHSSGLCSNGPALVLGIVELVSTR
jgi:hypothetical protein